MSPEAAIATILDSTLTGDATLTALLGTGTRVWQTQMDEEGLYPSVVYEFPSGAPFQANYHLESGMYGVLVKVHGKGCTPGHLDPIVERITDLLRDTAFVESGFRIRFTLRATDQDADNEGGDLFAVRILAYAVSVGNKT